VPLKVSKVIELDEQIFTINGCENITVGYSNLPSHLRVDYSHEDETITVMGTLAGVFDLVILAWVDGAPLVEIAEVEFTVEVTDLQVC
jgi:hypothetical protein